MNRWTMALGASLALALAGTAAAATKTPDVANTSFVMADGERTLQESVVIAAPLPILWKAFTDTDEFKRWSSPVAAIDLKVGGSLEASYDPKAKLGDPDNIRHRIITYVPQRLIVFQNIQAPRQLPDADRFQRTVTVVEYIPAGAGATRVVISSTGWGNDPQSQRLYKFFEADNAEVLEQMKKTYEAAAPGR
jgi:uncharacterized protein YndB with AHSA1/START domain